MPYIDISGRWKPRLENPDAVAGRLAYLLVGLSRIDPLFSGWTRGGMRHRSVVPRLVTSPPKAAELADWLAENPVFESRQGRKKNIGYTIHAETPRDKPIHVSLWLNANLTQSPECIANQIAINLFATGDGLKNSITLVRYALVTLAMAWDCDWVGAAAGDYSETRRQPAALPPRYQSGWMVYLDRTRASRLRKPKDIIVEMLPSGAVLLTSVTAALFDRHNSTHRAAAQRLQVVLAPLNVKTRSARRRLNR